MTIADVLEGRERWCVINGDCLDVMAEMPERCVDHVITDPPYDERTHRNAATRSDITRTARGVEEFAAFGVEEFAAFGVEEFAAFGITATRLAKRWALVFCSIESIGIYAGAAPDSWVRAGIWDKIAPAPQISGDRPGQAVEGIAIMHRHGRKKWNRGGGAGIWRWLAPKSDARNGHPTPKPIGLMLDLVSDFTDPGELVLDPFCGSGTTGVACLRLGRRFIGIEKEQKWADLARERLEAESQTSTLQARKAGQVPLFAEERKA